MYLYIQSSPLTLLINVYGLHAAEQVALQEERDSLLQLREEHNKERAAVVAADIPPVVGSGQA